jgi:hypothetical protein
MHIWSYTSHSYPALIPYQLPIQHFFPPSHLSSPIALPATYPALLLSPLPVHPCFSPNYLSSIASLPATYPALLLSHLPIRPCFPPTYLTSPASLPAACSALLPSLLSVQPCFSPNKDVLETIKNFFRFKPKQTETQSVSVVFRFVSRNQKKIFRFVSVCFGVSDRYRNNRNKRNFFETNRNKPKKIPKNALFKTLT